MIILGIDPGSVLIGYGLIEKTNDKLKSIAYGCIKAEKDDSALRLLEVYEKMEEIIENWQPQEMAIEELFFKHNAKTAFRVGETRGVIILSAAQKGIPVFSYKPSQVKQAVVGYGKAEKNQVQKMVQIILKLEEIPKPDDTADALALAICHAHSRWVLN